MPSKIDLVLEIFQKSTNVTWLLFRPALASNVKATVVPRYLMNVHALVFVCVSVSQLGFPGTTLGIL